MSNNFLSKILTLNILLSYEHLNWEVFMPNIGFGCEPRALALDLMSLLLRLKNSDRKEKNRERNRC